MTNKEMDVKNKNYILLVDDEEISRNNISELLVKYSYEVIPVQNGQEAMEALKRKQFDLIITELIMADMTGIDLLKTVKTATPKTGVIIATGYGDVESYLESMNLGAFEYLNKPIKELELKKTITRFFGRSLV